MTTEHERVRELLADWATGALPPSDEKAVPSHLAGCESCAAEAERLRRTVRPPGGPDGAGDGSPGPGAVPHRAGGARPTASRTPPAAAPVAAHAAPYAAAVAALRPLLREADTAGSWRTPVVHGWDVHATVAHLIAADEPLALRLGLAARVPPSRSVTGEGAGWREEWGARTAEVIAYERARAPRETVAAWAEQAADLLATREARELEPAAQCTTLMGVRLPVADHFLVRAFETWIHGADIGRALGLAVPPPPEPHLWQLVRLAVRILGTALGPQAAPVLFTVTGRGGDTEWVLGSEDEPVRAELVLDPVDLCLLVGGRSTPEEVPRGATGDSTAVRAVLDRAASLAWL
ncbi:maleylpyruvate isomerase family mycothiol-dependent enzyme [Streptomyces sp. NPDC086783]|uniref:maleylpyruvate isomerase family mycothiol-dependent enzyme n=1 Tax=Streptomyces sp. NPDC086783 TaxID=3365758 RepID=UPI003811AB10